MLLEARQAPVDRGGSSQWTFLPHCLLSTGSVWLTFFKMEHLLLPAVILLAAAPGQHPTDAACWPYTIGSAFSWFQGSLPHITSKVACLTKGAVCA